MFAKLSQSGHKINSAIAPVAELSNHKIYLETGSKKTYLNTHLKTNYMKPAATSLVLGLLLATTSHSQLSFLPQIGFEQAKTSVRINDVSSFSPMGFVNNFKANLRMDYRFKKGHGPYIGLGTAPGAIAFSFADATNVATNFNAVSNSLQFRMEAGYQYSSKPINLTKASKKESVKATTQHTQTRYRCGSYYNQGSRHRTATAAKVKPSDNLNLRLQPSVGVAYTPSIKDNLITTGSGYQYNAGNYKTAVVTGMGLEFGKGKQRLFTLSVFHTKGLGKLDEQSINNLENEKLPNTTLNSKSSGWGVMLGVPFSLAKTKKLIAPAKTFVPTHHHRQYYKSKCGGYYRSSESGVRKI